MSEELSLPQHTKEKSPNKATSVKDITKRVRDESVADKVNDSQFRPGVSASGIKEPTVEENEKLANTKEANPGQLTPTEKRKLKIKIDGMEEEIEMDDDQLRREVQRARAADKRFQAASEMNKRATELFEKMKNPDGLIEAIKSLGYDPQQLAEGYLYDRLQYEAMTPEQKMIRELQEEKRLRDIKDKQMMQTQEQAKTKEVTDRLAKEIQADIMASLQSGGLPPTPDNIWRMGHKMRAHLERGIDLPAKDAAALVMEDLRKEWRSTAKGMPADKLVEMFGQEIADNIRKHDLSKIKNPIPESRPRKEPPRMDNEPHRHYKTQDEFDKHMALIRAGKL